MEFFNSTTARNAHNQQSKGTIKGDDIAIAVDMLSDAFDDVYDVEISSRWLKSSFFRKEC